MQVCTAVEDCEKKIKVSEKPLNKQINEYAS